VSVTRSKLMRSAFSMLLIRRGRNGLCSGGFSQRRSSRSKPGKSAGTFGKSASECGRLEAYESAEENFELPRWLFAAECSYGIDAQGAQDRLRAGKECGDEDGEHHFE